MREFIMRMESAKRQSDAFTRAMCRLGALNSLAGEIALSMRWGHIPLGPTLDQVQQEIKRQRAIVKLIYLCRKPKAGDRQWKSIRWLIS